MQISDNVAEVHAKQFAGPFFRHACIAHNFQQAAIAAIVAAVTDQNVEMHTVAHHDAAGSGEQGAGFVNGHFFHGCVLPISRELQLSVAVQHAENGREDVEQGFDELNHGHSRGLGRLRQLRLPIPRTRGMSRAFENERIAFWSSYEWRSAGTVGRSYSISDDIRWR